MDDYTKTTIELLLERDKKYLREILCDICLSPDKVPQETDLNMDNVSAIIANRRPSQIQLHKSSIYKCVCGSNNVVTREAQTKSADEGSTIFCVCNKCGIIIHTHT